MEETTEETEKTKITWDHVKEQILKCKELDEQIKVVSETVNQFDEVDTSPEAVAALKSLLKENYLTVGVDDRTKRKRAIKQVMTGFSNEECQRIQAETASVLATLGVPFDQYKEKLQKY